MVALIVHQRAETRLITILEVDGDPVAVSLKSDRTDTELRQAAPIRSPSVGWFAWYTNAILALLAVVTSAITYAPEIEWIGMVLSPVFFGCSLLGCILADALGQLPADHWVHQSQPVRIGLAGLAVAVTLLLVLSG